MTTKARRYCISFPCSNLADAGAYCAEHRPARAPKEADPFYLGTTWRRFRDYYIRLHPLCEQCDIEGRGPVPARMVHHIKPLSEGGAKTSDDNAMSLCPKCHSIITKSYNADSSVKVKT